MGGAIALIVGNGFTVDDALISTRVAHHISSHAHYGFNRVGPPVDCVTPLGWAWLLAPFSGGGPWAGLQAARALGGVAALASAALLGSLVQLTSTSGRDWPRVTLLSVVLATCLPFGAWATSGMETSVVMLVCTASVWGFARGHWLGPTAAALAAASRPELAPWAAVLAMSSEVPILDANGETPQRRLAKRLLRVGCVAAGVLAAMAIRTAIFGSPVPLAVSAKPSDGTHGLVYTWGALRLLGFPVLLLGWRAYSRLPRAGVAVALAFGAHVLAVIGVGGDWMSLFRLFVPVLPATLWLCWLVIREQSSWFVALKGVLALAVNGLLLYSLGGSTRQVLAAREALIATGSPVLVGAANVAALDVGWVGAATSATITDLAGVTDPEVARLPGGHTSKRLQKNLLNRRGVDTLVLLLEPGAPSVAAGTRLGALRFARAVENSLAEQADAELYEVRATLPLLGTTQHYVVLRRTRTN